MSAQVAVVPELAENILAHLPPRDIVLAQRVSSTWRDLVQTSPTIKRALWPVIEPEDVLQPYGKDELGMIYARRGITESPLFPSIFRSSLCWEGELVFDVDPGDMSALWRGLPITSPPITDLRIASFTPTGRVDVVLIHKPTGVRFADVAEHVAKNDRFVIGGRKAWQPALAKGAEERKLNDRPLNLSAEECGWDYQKRWTERQAENWLENGAQMQRS